MINSSSDDDATVDDGRRVTRGDAWERGMRDAGCARAVVGGRTNAYIDARATTRDRRDMIDIARTERRRRKTDDIDGWIRIVSRARSDYGFDPLKLGEKPENLARYREAELMHARWSMLGVACLLYTSPSPRDRG